MQQFLKQTQKLLVTFDSSNTGQIQTQQKTVAQTGKQEMQIINKILDLDFLLQSSNSF